MDQDDWGIISVDDHVIEPPHTWTSRVPAKYRDRCPRVVERRDQGFTWDFDGEARMFSGLMCSVGTPPDEWVREIPRFGDLYIGCHDVETRLKDMDDSGILASLCFPTMPGFGGTFLNRNPDRALSYACIQAYNDFVTEEWCAAAPGRFIPGILVPYWDPRLAITELERVVPRGVRSVVFSERPHTQGFPSLFDKDRYWDPFFAAAQEMDLVLSCHIGSSSKVDMPDDANYLTHNSEIWLNAPYSMAEYTLSGTFDRFPGLKVAYSEASIGWMPFMLQTMDRYYRDQGAWTKIHFDRKPSDYFGTNIFGCFIRDPFGARFIEELGIDAIMVEVDYPHADTIWPSVRESIDSQLAHLTPQDQYKLRQGNAERVYGFKPSGLGQR
jgi:predicted TIM-barrel fold metal-dependent hydrolase